MSAGRQSVRCREVYDVEEMKCRKLRNVKGREARGMGLTEPRPDEKSNQSNTIQSEENQTELRAANVAGWDHGGKGDK